jgi:integrase
MPRIVVALLYGAWLRLQESLELRVKDIDFDRNQIVVRRGKGQKDRRTMLPETVKAQLAAHLREVRCQHQRDLSQGLGRVALPAAVEPQCRLRMELAVCVSCDANMPGRTLRTTVPISPARIPRAARGHRRRPPSGDREAG